MASRSFIDYLLNPGPDEAELQEAIRSAAGVADDIAAAFVAIDAAVAATAADVVTINAQVTYVEGVIAGFDADAAAALAAIATDRAAALTAIGTASTTAQGAINTTASSAITTVNAARDDAVDAANDAIADVDAAVTAAQAALVATGDSYTTDFNVIKADTEQFSIDAGIARDEAVAAAAAVDIPPIAPGDAGRVLTVKVDESGTEWVDAGVDLPAGGTTGQFLRKQSETDQDAAWATLPQASAIQSGIVELATPAEVITGTDQDRAATAQGVRAAINRYVPRGHLYGLTLSNNVTDVVNDIDIAEGEAKADDQLTLITLAAAMTKRLDAAWAAGTNQGMLDTGAIANTTYHLFLIENRTTFAVDVLASLSPTAPTMPAGWVGKRRIGAIIRKAAAILLFRQYGDMFKLNTPQLDYSSTALITDTLVAFSVPAGIVVAPIFNGDLSTAGATATVILAADGSQPTAESSILRVSSAGDYKTAGPLDGFASDTAGRLKFTVLGAPSGLRLWSMGWIDGRGR